MIQYIYFVKCPNCEDEHFDFLDDAKAYALGRLSAKPIITQVEVNRDDFGCCTDSCDLGTIWSYEDALGNDCGSKEDNELSTFTKSETFGISDDDFDEEFEDDEITVTVGDTEIEIDDDEIEIERISDEERKPIPEDMTIKDLVEAMEENEEMVECTWCEDLFEKSECRYEVNLGWLCDRCQAAIMSRGEPLTVRENNYWDFLDEEDNDTSAEDLVWTCVFDDQEIGTVTAKTKEEAEEKMQHEYPDYPYGLYDGCFEVYLKEDITKLTEGYTDEVELEYSDFDDKYGPDSYTYRVDRNKVIEYIIDYKLDDLSDEELKALLKLTKAPEEYSGEEYFQAIEDNFDEVFKKFEDDIYYYFSEDCEEEYYSHDWEEIACEQAMEFQWECDNDR
jgi:hypothetical protein